jgi:hypothetical protein
VNALDSLISDLKDVCADLPDQHKGPRRETEYSMADIGLSAFSVFFMETPSFLAHQRTLEQGQGRSNCQCLFVEIRRRENGGGGGTAGQTRRDWA